MQNIIILGATGSIGRSAAAVILAHRDRFRVTAVVGGSDAVALAETARRLKADFAVLADETKTCELREALSGSSTESGAGAFAVREAVDREADVVLAAICGAAGLEPAYRALKPGRRLALANKESLVCAGDFFMREARRLGVAIVPVDSEHNALSQALGKGRMDDVARMTLTASGGPFRLWPPERIAAATPEQALAHPVWSMGAKISIDSATLMNKGLELIEAHHLFGLAPKKFDVLIHPQSIVHGLVTWSDGAVTAGMAHPDMRIPIADALSLERRLPLDAPAFDLAAIGALTFEKPDEGKFPCLRLAREALRQGGSMPTWLNAANEVAVEAFLAKRIPFGAIAGLVAGVCEAGPRMSSAPASIEEALAIDEQARYCTWNILGHDSDNRKAVYG